MSRWGVLCLGLAGLCVQPALALTGTINGDAADAQVNQVGTVKSVSDQTSTLTRVGNNSSDGKQSCVVHVFQIPSSILSDPTQKFDSATYTARLTWINVTTRNADLYGLGYRTSPTVLAGDYYTGAQDSAVTLLKDNYLAPGLANYTAISVTGATLVDYLNAQLTAARAAGATVAYVFFRTTPDSTVLWQFYQLGMAEAGGANVPTLAYTTVVEPARGTVIMVSSLSDRRDRGMSRDARKARKQTSDDVVQPAGPNA